MTALVGPQAAYAGKADDTLNVAFKTEITGRDRFFDLTVATSIITPHVWDHLLYADPITAEIKLGLATSYKVIDAVTMEFELRKGVKFHDGSDFDADDVVYTLNFAADPKNKIRNRSAVKWIKNAEKLGSHKIRLNFKAPNSVATQFLAQDLNIVPDGYYDNGIGRNNVDPVGTGPYKITKTDPGKSYLLERFDNHYEGSPKGKPSIGKIHVRIIPETTTQIAEVMVAAWTGCMSFRSSILSQ